MTKLRLMLAALLTLCVSATAFASQPTLIMKNQFGEQSNNHIIGGTYLTAHVLTFTSAVSAGGSATETYTVTGLLSTDTILAVSQSIKGSNSLPLLGFNTLATNSLKGVYSADPGTGAKIVVTVLR